MYSMKLKKYQMCIRCTCIWFKLIADVRILSVPVRVLYRTLSIDCYRTCYRGRLEVLPTYLTHLGTPIVPYLPTLKVPI
jgi:hypothetical protein